MRSTPHSPGITAAQSLANTVSVTCKVIDDGEFTVPEEFASQLVFGGGGDGMMDQMLSMMNMVIFDRHTESPITGDGISVGKVSSEQLIMAKNLMIDYSERDRTPSTAPL